MAHCHDHIRRLMFCVVTHQTSHFAVWEPGVEPTTPKFEFERDFCTMHLTAKFHHRTFNRTEVIMLTKQTDKLTNKQTDAAENIHLAPLCYAGG